MQIRVGTRQLNQPPHDGLTAGYEELALLPGQALVGPDQDGKAAAVDEIKPGEIHHQDPRVLLQRAADGTAQTVPGAQVKLALQQQHRPPPMVLDGDGQVGVGGHLLRFR
jgi:hypothetical protein